MEYCPECKTEAAISGVERRGERDGEKVRVYEIQIFSCRNPNCPRYQKKTAERAHLLYEGVPENKV